MSRTIEEILTAAGVTISNGKMECPGCSEKKLTASHRKGVAKCWGCGRAWTERGDSRTPERDWAAHLLTTIAEACQACLPSDPGTLGWLAKRGLPVDDTAWLEENDLGSLPGNLDISLLKHHAKERFNEWHSDKLKELESLKLQLHGPRKKYAVEQMTSITDLIAEEQANLDNTLERLPMLNSRDWADSVVYLYRNAVGTPTSLNIRCWSDEDENRKKQVRRLQPRPNQRGLFGVTDALFEPGESWQSLSHGAAARTIVVEGEHNLLALRAATRRWGVAWYIPGVAMGGKNGADVQALEKLLDGSDPLVVYDNDTIELATGRPAGFALVESIRERLYAWVTCTGKPDKDLDDYIVARPELEQKAFYKDIIRTTVFFPIKYATIAGRVQRDLEHKGLEKNDRVRRVTSTIVADAMRRAKLFNADGLAALLLPEYDDDDKADKAELIPAQANHDRFTVLMSRYGVFDREWIAIVAHAFIMRAAHEDVPRTKVHSLAHWASDTNTLYVNLYDGSMLRMRICGAEKRQVTTQRVPVGTDDVLLLRSSANAKYTPWSYRKDELALVTPGSMRITNDSIIDQTILCSVNYPSDREKYKQILKTWMLSLFFGSDSMSKPVLMFEGLGGGGKTSVGLGLGSMLMGPGFVVNNAPTTGKEVAEKMSGTPLVVWDEWDEPCKEVETALKTLTTGAQDSRRQLYETSKVVELSCDAAVITTSNSNPIRQAGGSRRVIVIPVAPRVGPVVDGAEADDEKYKSMGAYLRPFLQTKRDAMWKELISDLARCIIAMANTPADTRTVFSMADFGVFAQRCANDEGWGDEARELFRWVNAQQEGQQAENRVILSLLTERLRKNHNLIGQWMSAKDWTTALHDVIPGYDRGLQNRVNKAFFAYETKTFKDLFEKQLGMKLDQNKHLKITLYSFNPPWAVQPEPSNADDVEDYLTGSPTTGMAVQ